LSDRKTLTLDKIESRLREVKETFNEIGHIDVYGGEIFLLEEDYLNELLSILEKYSHPPFNFITNLTKLPKIIQDERIYLSVSFDFEAREQAQKVFKHMALLEKDFSLLILASEKVLKMDVEDQIARLNLLSRLQSVEIKPYSSNQSNQHEITNLDFTHYVKKWIESPTQKRFQFVNEDRIHASLNKVYSAFSDEHLYITPSGNFGVLEFDLDDHEFFLELENLSDYLSWSKQEKNKVKENKYCSQCQYMGHCLTEHYREVTSLESDCNGFKKLLDWYHEARI
jgi:hypothetical protein